MFSTTMSRRGARRASLGWPALDPWEKKNTMNAVQKKRSQTVLERDRERKKTNNNKRRNKRRKERMEKREGSSTEIGRKEMEARVQKNAKGNKKNI